MSFKTVTDFYEAYAEYVADLEERAGVPRPCPRCGRHVVIHTDELPDGGKTYYWVGCFEFHYECGYKNDHYAWSAEDAWREHERACAAEEDEG